MGNEDERRLILEMIDNGKISAEDGLRLLQALPVDEQEEDEFPDTFYPEDELKIIVSGEPAAVEYSPIIEAATSESPEHEYDQDYTSTGETKSSMPDFDRWRRYWIYPLWIGVGITVVGSLLMFWAAQATGLGFWFFCAGIPFTLGIVILVLAWQSRTAHWLHLRVQQKPGEWPRTIAFSFPLPLRISSWFLRTFRTHIPGMEEASVDEVLAALEQSTSPDNPLYIEVDEDDGERVQIYIG